LASKLRRRILTPPMSETKLSVRGFNEKSPESRDLLEKVGESFLTGYAYAAEAGRSTEAEEPLEKLPTYFKGFAYEGAGMALGVRDGLPFGSTRHVSDFLSGAAEKHIYMVYVGVGWSLARVPRFRWKAATAGITDDLLRWLVLDGYGFDRAYFDTKRWIDKQYVPAPYPWQGSADYFPRAVDQGIGRALWFIHGAQTADVAAAVLRFPEHRRADLWSGVGLAATFAGGCDADALTALRSAAAEHGDHLGLGSVFAIKARHHCGYVPPHTATAASALAGLTVAEAVAMADETEVAADTPGPVPAYELWRQRIRARLAVPGTARHSTLEVGR